MSLRRLAAVALAVAVAGAAVYLWEKRPGAERSAIRVGVLHSLTGTMAASEVPWATIWLVRKTRVRIGTNARPPPIPIVPLRTPASTPPTIAARSCQLTEARSA